MAQHAIIATSVSGKITYFNPAASRLLGYTAAEVVGKHTPIIFHESGGIAAWLKDNPGSNPFLCLVQHCAPDVAAGSEIIYVRKDGRRIPVMLTVSKVRDPQGQLQGYMGIALELSANKRQQHLYETFFSLGHEMLCVCGPQGKLLRVNLAFENLLGYAVRDLEGTNIFAKIHADDLEATKLVMANLGRGEVVSRFNNRWLHRDGSYRTIRWNAAASADGFYYATGWDVTDEQQQSDSKDQNALFEKQLIGIVSHDLRSPVSAILMSAESIGRLGGLSQRAERSLKRISGAAQRAERMIHDLLDFTQARLGGGLRVHPAPVNINEVAQQVMEEIQLVHPEREITFSPCDAAEVRVDGDRIAQVLGNLLANAVHYSPKDSPVDLSIDKRNDALCLEVHNGGDPIPAHLLPRLFKPLHRGANGLGSLQASAGRSVGLGLYIVDQAVKAHGGVISVESTPEAGTTFSVVLPQHAPASKHLQN